VLDERFEIVPAAPVTDEQRVDVLALQLRRPSSPEIVKRQLLPAGIVLVGELLARRLDPVMSSR